ncbi:MAG: NADH-ubiquinone oxidoreductase-F iron-sulfur binding region domain-containing protein [Candidatus Freyarchaeota archaeon]
MPSSMYEWSLMEKCCEKCTHSALNPCRNYITCMVNGPLCHESVECKEKRVKRIDEIKYGRQGLRITVGMASCGLAVGAREVYKAIEAEVKERGLKATVEPVGCMGLCYAEPLIELSMKGMSNAIYSKVTPEKVSSILDEYLNRDVSNAFALRSKNGTMKGEDSVPLLQEIDFYKWQVKWVTRNCGIINPTSIEQYIAYGGYLGLHRALSLSPEKIIKEIKNSGLRGRGGAGFPTWLKWDICRKVPSETKYVICNGDEGDPGAFMNRLLAESDPHRILEGLIIAAYAIGAAQGYIFVRAEKPLMAERFEGAVKEAKKYGLLGNNILNTGFSFDVKVIRSAGAFVCGEETALIAAIEGKRAMPRQRPPYPATKGLFGKPTIINNVETLAHVATIMSNGWEKFAKYGTERSKGTKMFCITGAVKRTGAAEVPIGITIRDLVFKIAGGVREGRRFKAVQIGGPSGGCLPQEMLDLGVDYESLKSAGAIMGSGGLVVIDNSSCIVDVARYFTTFTMAESCGKCVPCRIGTKILYDTLTRIIEGEGLEEDLKTLEEVGNLMKDASLCALGQTAPNPVLTTLRYFREEYEAHIKAKRCPAKVCNKLVDYFILEDVCIGCGSCTKECPVNAIAKNDDGKYSIDMSKCVRCGQCIIVCPRNAIVKR